MDCKGIVIMEQIEFILFDVDGVVTDGICYKSRDNSDVIIKGIQLKDLDAIGLLKEVGFQVGVISGEDNSYLFGSDILSRLDICLWKCKNKGKAIDYVCDLFHITEKHICYIGDGKYDIPVLKKVGLSVCPSDAIDDVKKISDVILDCAGGCGCLAEICSKLISNKKRCNRSTSIHTDLQKDIFSIMEKQMQVIHSMLQNPFIADSITQCIDAIVDCYNHNGCVLVCGNGGSAADSQHFAAELVGRFYLERKALNAKALTENTAVITAISNDYDYASVFSRQIEAYGRKGDVLLALSTSGKSENIKKAIIAANEKELTTIMITGNHELLFNTNETPNIIIKIPCCMTPRIQEAMLLIEHIICEFVEKSTSISHQADNSSFIKGEV